MSEIINEHSWEKLKVSLKGMGAFSKKHKPHNFGLVLQFADQAH